MAAALRDYVLPADRVVIGARIGCGSDGAVFLATFAGQRVAVKRPHALSEEGLALYGITRGSAEYMLVVSGMDRESALLRQLPHPNILQFMGVVKDAEGTTLGMVTEYANGGDLLGWLARHQPAGIPLSTFLHLYRSLAAALAFLHARGVIHRDIKPNNVLVFLTGDGGTVFKLGGFGSARVLELPGDAGGRRRLSIGVGTPFFRAPEVNTEEYDYRADVYSLGVTMAEVAVTSLAGTGRPFLDPFKAFGGSRGDMVDEAVDRVTALSPDLVALMSGSCAAVVGDRPTSADVLARLEAVPAPAAAGSGASK